MPYGIMLFICS